MKSIQRILFFFLFIPSTLFAQTSHADFILDKHINATTRTSWSSFNTIREAGTETYADSSILSWKKHKKGIDRMRLEMHDKKGYRVVGENEAMIWRVVNGQVIEVPKVYRSSPTRFNFSYAISLRKIYNLSIRHLSDSLVNQKNYHLFLVKEENDSFGKILYINAMTSLIDRVDYLGSVKEMVLLDNYRWVGDFLIAHSETGFKNGFYDFKIDITECEVNVVLEDSLFVK